MAAVLWTRRYFLPLLLLLSAATPASGSPYVWPLKRFAGLSSLFGDYRPFRYHAGCDLRTGGEEGWPVRAVADGYVMRASTSYNGYGRALYLKLDDGRIAVYGHLQAFGPQVTQRVREEQRKLKRYKTDQYFEANAIRVRKGMIIARSGQTGAGAPHLHFEIRTGDNKPLNPLSHGFRTVDSRDPEIAELWVIPQRESGELGAARAGVVPAVIPLEGNPRRPLRPRGGTIYAAGPIGFAVEAYDRKPGTNFRFNPYEFVLIVAGDTVYQSRYDTLVYNSMYQVELERPIWLDASGDTYNLYKAVGNEMPHSRANPKYPHGIVTVNPGDSAVPMKLVVLDEHQNTRTILAKLTYREPRLLRPEGWGKTADVRAGYIEYQAEDTSVFAIRRQIVGGVLSDQPWVELRGQPRIHRLYAADATLRSSFPLTIDLDTDVPYELVRLQPDEETTFALPDSSLIVTVPRGSVFEPSWMWIQRDRADGEPVWRLGPRDLVLTQPVSLSFVAPDDSTISLWIREVDSGKLEFVDRRRDQGRIPCTARQPGTYTLARDTTPPVIARLRPAEQQSVGRDAIITAVLTDDLSRVGDDTMISVLLDGEWIPPEYDPETHILKAEPWQPLKPGTHTVTIRVADWAGNESEAVHTFRVR